MINYATDSDGTGFLEINPIYNLNLYKKRYVYKTNIKTNNIDDYLDEYVYEYRKLKRTYKNKKNIEGYKIKYLLPITFNRKKDKSKIKVLANNIVEFISPANKIPYFAYVSKGSKGITYLSIILLDRYYFPQGRVIQTKRPNTRIVDNSGKIVAKDDYDPSKHTLKWSKGDLYEKTIIMSDKLRLDDVFTQGVNTELFKERIARIKKKLVYEVNKIFGVRIVHVKKFIKKLTYKQRIQTDTSWIHVEKRQLEHDKAYYYRRRKVRAINNYIEKANEMLTCISCEATIERASKAIQSQIEEAKKTRMVKDVENMLDDVQLLLYFT